MVSISFQDSDDKKPLSTERTLVVNVKDVQDTAPRFQNLPYIVTIPENTPKVGIPKRSGISITWQSLPPVFFYLILGTQKSSIFLIFPCHGSNICTTMHFMIENDKFMISGVILGYLGAYLSDLRCKKRFRGSFYT